MRYFLFLIAIALFYSCASYEVKEDEENPNEEKITELERQFKSLDTLILLCKDYTIVIKDFQYLTEKWANHQSNSDDPDKTKLNNTIKTCDDALISLKKYTDPKIQQNIEEISEYQETSIMIAQEIKSLLPDFASYEDVANAFYTQTSVGVESDFQRNITKIQFNLQYIEEWAAHEKEMISLELKKLSGK